MLDVIPAGAFTVKLTTFLAAPLSVTPTVNFAILPTRAVPEAADWVMAKFGPGVPELEAEFHWLTSNAPSTEPKPVAGL
jgi:hypothetical protein